MYGPSEVALEGRGMVPPDRQAPRQKKNHQPPDPLPLSPRTWQGRPGPAPRTMRDGTAATPRPRRREAIRTPHGPYGRPTQQASRQEKKKGRGGGARPPPPPPTSTRHSRRSAAQTPATGPAPHLTFPPLVHHSRATLEQRLAESPAGPVAHARERVAWRGVAWRRRRHRP